MSCEDSVGDADDPVKGCNLIRSFHSVHRLQMLCGRRRCTTGAIRPLRHADGQLRVLRYQTECLKGDQACPQPEQAVHASASPQQLGREFSERCHHVSREHIALHNKL